MKKNIYALLFLSCIIVITNCKKQTVSEKQEQTIQQDSTRGINFKLVRTNPEAYGYKLASKNELIKTDLIKVKGNKNVFIDTIVKYYSIYLNESKKTIFIRSKTSKNTRLNSQRLLSNYQFKIQSYRCICPELCYSDELDDITCVYGGGVRTNGVIYEGELTSVYGYDSDWGPWFWSIEYGEFDVEDEVYDVVKDMVDHCIVDNWLVFAPW